MLLSTLGERKMAMDVMNIPGNVNINFKRLFHMSFSNLGAMSNLMIFFNGCKVMD